MVGMNTKILIICIMALAVVIGVALGLAVSQATKDAKDFGFNSAGELMMNRFTLWLANVGAPLAIFIILGLPAIGVGLTVWWKLRNKKSRS
jgi:hypothetical protein